MKINSPFLSFSWPNLQSISKSMVWILIDIHDICPPPLKHWAKILVNSEFNWKKLFAIKDWFRVMMSIQFLCESFGGPCIVENIKNNKRVSTYINFFIFSVIYIFTSLKKWIFIDFWRKNYFLMYSAFKK